MLEIKISLLTMILVGTVASAQSNNAKANQQPPSRVTSPNLHGTVNIFLANKNGLVALTDSRLSSSGRTASDEGKKLYKIDDHTICTIAGWYSSAGPINGNFYPAYVAIPNVMNRYINEASLDLSRRPVEEKAFLLAGTLRFILNVVGTIAQYSGLPPNTSPSQLTLGTIENGKVMIAKIMVTPHLVNGRAVYAIGELKIDKVEDSAIHSVAGIPEIAEPILDHPQNFRTGSAVLNYYTESIARDKGRSLSTEDMKQVARKLEDLTSRSFRAEVGGPVQSAVLTVGGIDLEEPFTIPLTGDFIPRVFLDANGGSCTQCKGVVTLGPSMFAFVHGISIKDSGQQLDNIFLYDNKFERATLTYAGTENFVFDKSNKIVDSKLILDDGVDPKSTSVVRIRRDFPNLPIIQRGKLVSP